MKKYLIFYITVFSALLLAGCAREEFPAEKKTFADGQTGLVMRVHSIAPQTRLLDPVTDAQLNEYRLEQFYYFIYNVDPSLKDETTDNTMKAPVYVGKWTAPTGSVVTNKGTEEKIPLDEYTALKVDENTYSGYVYVIANYKSGTVDEEGKDVITSVWDAAISDASPDYSTFTWTYLQNLELPATFDTYQIAPDSECMNEKADKPVYRFKSQDSFIMASAPTPFTVTKGEVKDIDAPLERLAVKISLDINLAKWYVQKNNGVYKYTWYSDPARIQVYLSYAAKLGKMDGTPLAYQEGSTDITSGHFFNYRRFAFIPNWVSKTTDEDTGVSSYTFPDGSFPVKEPLHWIHDESLATYEGEGEERIRIDNDEIREGAYYTSDEDKAGSVVEVNGEIQYTTFTRQAYSVTGTPFYSYPNDFRGDSNYAPFFKVIVEWTAKNEVDNEAAGTKRATDTEPGVGGTNEIVAREFYYKITMPDKDKDKNDIPRIWNANQWYKVTLNLSVLGSEADETAIDISGDQGYYVIDWSNPIEPEVPELNAGRYLSVSPKFDKAKVGYDFEMNAINSLEIPVSSSHELVVVPPGNQAASYPNYSGDNVTTSYLTYSTQSSSDNYYQITPNGSSSVTLTHNLNSSLGSMNPRDVAPITYTFRIQHKDDASYYADITVRQYPSMYILAQMNTDGTNDNEHGYVYINNLHSTNTGYDWSNCTTLYGQNNSNPNMYVITTTVLKNSSYILGDPRSETVNNTLNNGNWYHSSSPRIEGGTGPLKYYYPTSQSSQAHNMVAPKLRVASSYGKSSRMSYNDALRRCASYQEDGYPAGRWRIPTASEILFICSLSQNNPRLMPELFTFAATGNDDAYWCADGKIDGRNGTPTYVEGTANDTRWIRCVYDEWYWEGTNHATVNKTTFTWGDEPR